MLSTTSGPAEAQSPSSSTGAVLGTATPSDSEASFVSETTAELRKELDQKLEALVQEEEPEPPKVQPASELPTVIPAPSSNDPFGFVCAFGFTGSFDQPEAVPKTKGVFLNAINAEIEGIGMIQRGLQSYQGAINSRRHHTFSTEFLINQNTATVITLDQLDQITAHLKEVEKEVQKIGEEEGEVGRELLDAFEHARPWVSRTRAILRHCHVFYKINFVLASDKKTTKA